MVVAVRRIFRAETREYFLLLGTTLFLVVFGLVMVLSSSSVESLASDGDFFARVGRQVLFAIVGVPLMLLAAQMPILFWKRWAGLILVVGAGLQLLVFTGLGYDNGYNQNWIQLAGFTFQPSEFIKLGLVLWIALTLGRRQDQLADWRRVLLPVGPVAAVAVGLVLAGKDLGTVMIMVGIVLGAAFYAGVRLWMLGIGAVGIGVFAMIAIQGTTSRGNRISAWLSGCSDTADYAGDCYQTVNAWESLAHGGIVGAGLGNSSGKWFWVPEAETDFIFAIIGEELGLIGAILVLALFVILTIAFIRVARLVRDPFARIATGAAAVWIVGQALVNIAVVLGLLPVLGVPLPLVSAGGSSLVSTLLVIGIVLSFARHRPEQEAAIVPPIRTAAPRSPRA